MRLEHLIVGLLLQCSRQLLIRLRSTSQTDECSCNTAASMSHEDFEDFHDFVQS